MENIIKVSNIVKTFKLSRKQQKIDRTTSSLKVAVDNLSFTVRKGEVYGLLGPNGAGKTTTLRMLATLITQDSGSIEVNSYDTIKNANEVRNSIGFLTSDLRLEEYFTPNYSFDYYSELRGIDPVVRDQWRKQIFARFGINEFAEIKISDLSTGMKQKISIAVSLVHNPDIIIFDEPTNGLDVITAKSVTDFLIEMKNEGKTIVVSTHIFSLIEKICDRVGIIIRGQMVAEDTLERVCNGKSLEDAFFDIYVQEETNL